MGRCAYELLKDIEPLLKEVRKLKKIKEPKPGIFYFKNDGFLHFHIDNENNRWADIKVGDDWGPTFRLPFPPSKKVQAEFLKTIKANYKILGGDE